MRQSERSLAHPIVGSKRANGFADTPSVGWLDDDSPTAGPTPLVVGPAEESETYPISLGDLLSWPESPVEAADHGLVGDDRERTVGWPVSWQHAGAPPSVAGALVLVSTAILRRLGGELPAAFAALHAAGVAGIVLEPGTAIARPDLSPPLLVARAAFGGATEQRLLQVLHTRRTLLYQRRYALERALTDSTLQGRRGVELLRIGAAQLRRTIHLLDASGATVGVYGLRHILPGKHPPTPLAVPLDEELPLVEVADPAADARWLFASIGTQVGVAFGGWLAVGGPHAAFDEGDRLILARLATVFAATEAEPSPPHRGDLVARLLRLGTPEDERQELANSLNLRPNGTFVVLRFLAAAIATDAWSIVRSLQRVLLTQRVRSDAFTDASGEPCGLLLHTSSTEPGGIIAALAYARDALVAESADFLVAIGGPSLGIARLPEADGEAGYGLALLQAELVPGPLADWNGGADLGHYQALYPLWGAASTTDFLRNTLGELLQRDVRQINELLQTLLAFVRFSGNAGAASTMLAIHRNTLSYRLRQIEQLTGRSPYDPVQLLSLVLAALFWTLPPTLGTVAAALSAD